MFFPFTQSPPQLPYRTGPHGTQARLSIDETMNCLIQISRYRFSLVISGLTKMLQRVNEIVSIGPTSPVRAVR